MKKSWSMTCSLILIAATVALAAPRQLENQVSAPPTQKTHTGEVVSVDTAKNQITLKEATGSELRLSVSPTAKITKAGQTMRLAEIKPGDKITVTCDESTGKCLVTAIKVGEADSERSSA